MSSDKQKRQLAMIQEFQCPGCMLGSSPETCHQFTLYEEKNPYMKGCEGFRCNSHHPSTFIMGPGKILLGFPKGFNRVGPMEKLPVKLYLKESTLHNDKFNVAVWAMKKDGYLFVRSYSPRINAPSVEVFEGGDERELPEGAIDVSKFWDEMD